MQAVVARNHEDKNGISITKISNYIKKNNKQIDMLSIDKAKIKVLLQSAVETNKIKKLSKWYGISPSVINKTQKAKGVIVKKKKRKKKKKC